MIFKKTGFKGAQLVDLEKNEDARGFFSRFFCEKEFAERNLNLSIKQSNLSYNKRKGTLRGMHYQASPYEEVKLVTCIKGAMFDVIIDLRPDSPTYCKWFSVEMDARNYTSLYVPKGFAHGFQTLEDDTVILYQMSEFYHPEYARGIRWNDSLFGIKWPIQEIVISEPDRSYPYYINNL